MRRPTDQGEAGTRLKLHRDRPKRKPLKVREEVESMEILNLKAIHFLLFNINQCARAQALLLQSMAEQLLHMALVAEAYLVSSRDNCIGDQKGLVATILQRDVGFPPLEKV